MKAHELCFGLVCPCSAAGHSSDELCAVPGTTTAPAKHTFFMSNGNDIDLPCMVVSVLSESEYEVVYSDQSLMN